jgi:hypothetical protein
MNQKRILTHKEFTLKLLKYIFLLSLMIIFSLIIGVIGYKYFAHLSWIDSFYNASMILTGMGPVDEMKNTNAKLFSSIYAIYSGVVFLSSLAIVVTPIVHRLMLRFHLDDKS